jgi:hypothetical protein
LVFRRVNLLALAENLLALGQLAETSASPTAELPFASSFRPHGVTLAPGQIISGVDFGNHRQRAPVVANDSVTTDEDVETTIDVLANDSDRDGALDPSQVSITWAPSYGIAVVDPLTGHVTYAPGANFFGSDSFRYRVKDNEGLSSDEAIVSITVNSINDSPLASAGSDQTVRLGSVAQLNASASSDLDNDPLSYRWIQTDGSPVTLIDGNSAAPSFIPMKAGRYSFDLVVSDGKIESVDSVVIDVPVFGDLNGDGYVNTADLQRLLTALDSASGGLNDPFDLDGDGWISVEDLRRLVRSYTRQRMGLPVR